MTRASFLPRAGIRRLERFLDALRAAARKPGEKEIHDLRVAIRRLLAHLELTGALAGERPGGSLALRKELRRLMRPLGRLRDAHVKLLRIRKLLPAPDPGSRLYALAVRSDSEKWEAVALRALKAANPGRFRKRFRSCSVPQSQADAPDGSLLAQLRGREEAVARLAKDYLSGRSPDALHEFRLAFKAYRYTAEVLSPLLPGLTPDAASRLHDFQTLLGDLHDFDVLLEEARRFRLRVMGSPDAPYGIEIAVSAARADSEKALLASLEGKFGDKGMSPPRIFA